MQMNNESISLVHLACCKSNADERHQDRGRRDAQLKLETRRTCWDTTRYCVVGVQWGDNLPDLINPGV